MNEILKMLNALKADDLESVIMRANIILEKKRKEEAEAALLEKERQRQERIAQEKRRQEEIAQLQRRLQELQNQSAAAQKEPNEVKGDTFVMYDAPKAAVNPQPSPAPVKPQPAQIVCPHCRQLNKPDSLFCEHCGQRLSSQQPAVQPQTRTAPATRSRVSAAQVRYADENMKKWELQPDEKVVYSSHEIQLLQPDLGRKYQYSMQVTNKRILFTRISAVAAASGAAFGLIGSLAREVAGAGPKPWLEIPLRAVSSCGVQNKKEFFIAADQTYVLKNHGYEKFLPDLVAKAKA